MPKHLAIPEPTHVPTTDAPRSRARWRWLRNPIVALIAVALAISGTWWGLAVLPAVADCQPGSGSGQGGTGTCAAPPGGTEGNVQSHMLYYDVMDLATGVPIQGYGIQSFYNLVGFSGGNNSPTVQRAGGDALNAATNTAYYNMYLACTDALAQADQRAAAFANSAAGRAAGVQFDPNNPRSRVVWMWYAGDGTDQWGYGLEFPQKVTNSWNAMKSQIARPRQDSQVDDWGWLDVPGYETADYRGRAQGKITNAPITTINGSKVSYLDNLDTLVTTGVVPTLKPGSSNTASCIALSQFEPPLGPTTYTVSGVTQQQGGFPVSGGTQSVSDRVTLSRQPAGDGEPVNATFTLNWDSGDPNNDPDKTAKKTAQVTTNGTANGPGFTPADFDWQVWPAGDYWWDVQVAKQGNMHSGLDLWGRGVGSESWQAKTTPTVTTTAHLLHGSASHPPRKHRSSTRIWG